MVMVYSEFYLYVLKSLPKELYDEAQKINEHSGKPNCLSALWLKEHWLAGKECGTGFNRNTGHIITCSRCRIINEVYKYNVDNRNTPNAPEPTCEDMSRCIDMLLALEKSKSKIPGNVGTFPVALLRAHIASCEKCTKKATNGVDEIDTD